MHGFFNSIGTDKHTVNIITLTLIFHALQLCNCARDALFYYSLHADYICASTLIINLSVLYYASGIALA